jgi:hypothetical protein
MTSGGQYVGENTYDYFGRELANFGDMDGDGIDDLLVGAPGADYNGYSSGRIYGLTGATSVLEVVSNNIGSTPGDNSYDYFGSGLANLGDIDGSGETTTAWGAYGVDVNGGTSGQLSMSNFSGSTALVMHGSNIYDYLGYQDRVTGAGDLDGDGFDDWVASGAQGYYSSPQYSGSLWVFYGASTVSWASVSDADATITGVSSYNYLGGTLTGGSDVDGDGYSDFVATNTDSANVYVGGATRMTGSTTASISVTDSSNSYPDFNYSELSMGDLNNDGEGDLIVADYYGSSSAGAVWTFYGPLSAGSYDVTAADSTLTGTGTYSYFGKSNLVGDVSGDGVDDLMVGSDGDAAIYIFNGGGM